MKQNNPGCNCCGGKVLVWDVGLWGRVLCGFTSFASWGETASLSGYEFDYALGASGADPFFWDPGRGYCTSNQASPPGPIISFDPNADPNDENSENFGYWTGNITDYDLVILRLPTSEDRCYACELVCGNQIFDQHWNGGVFASDYPTTNGDARYVRSGRPRWWSQLKDFTGRLLITGGPNSSGLALAIPFMNAYPANKFINELLAEIGSTIRLNTDYAPYDDAAGFRDPACAGGNVISGSYPPVDVSPSPHFLMESILSFPSWSTTDVSGGTSLVNTGHRYIDQWCLHTNCDLVAGSSIMRWQLIQMDPLVNKWFELLVAGDDVLPLLIDLTGTSFEYGLNETHRQAQLTFLRNLVELDVATP